MIRSRPPFGQVQTEVSGSDGFEIPGNIQTSKIRVKCYDKADSNIQIQDLDIIHHLERNIRRFERKILRTIVIQDKGTDARRRTTKKLGNW